MVDKPTDVVCSVPCGSYGILVAGLIAKCMGLPVKRFVAVTNCNDTFVRYLNTGDFRPQPVVST